MSFRASSSSCAGSLSTWVPPRLSSRQDRMQLAVDRCRNVPLYSALYRMLSNLPAADPIKGQTNLMYTMHFYAATHKQELRDRTDAAIKAGLPIFVSESAGMKATGDGPLNETEWKAWIDWMNDRKLSWITWSVSDKNESCSVLNNNASEYGGWKTDDLKESGIKTREILRNKAKSK